MQNLQLLAPSYFTRFVYLTYVLRRRILAIFLAAYGTFDSFYDIHFIRTLRNRESEAAAQAAGTSNNDQNSWNYGQVLAVLVWAPIFVEYLYVIIKGPEESKDKRRLSAGEAFIDETKHVAVPVSDLA